MCICQQQLSTVIRGGLQVHSGPAALAKFNLTSRRELFPGLQRLDARALHCHQASDKPLHMRHLAARHWLTCPMRGQGPRRCADPRFMGSRCA